MGIGLVLTYFASCSAVHGENPPVSIVRKFVHLLDLGDTDYTEEIGKRRVAILIVQWLPTQVSSGPAAKSRAALWSHVCLSPSLLWKTPLPPAAKNIFTPQTITPRSDNLKRTLNWHPAAQPSRRLSVSLFCFPTTFPPCRTGEAEAASCGRYQEQPVSGVGSQPDGHQNRTVSQEQNHTAG